MRSTTPRPYHQSGYIKILVPVVVASLILLGFLFLGSDPETPVSEVDDRESPIVTETASVTQEPEVPAPAADEPTEVTPRATVDIGGGLVVDGRTDKPLAGATVTLLMRPYGRPWETLHKDRTDAEGRYVMRIDGFVANREYQILCSKKGYVPQIRYFDYFRGGDYWNRTIRMHPGVRLTGEVVTAAGSAVTEGWVHLRKPLQLQPSQSWWGNSDRTPYTYQNWQGIPIALNSKGRFETFVECVRLAVEADCPGYAPATSEAVIPDSRTGAHLVVTVEEGQSAEALVVDAGGEPVPGATVRIYPRVRDVEPDVRFGSYLSRREGTTDAEGSVKITGVTEEIQRVEVVHPDYVTHSKWEVQPSDKLLEVTLSRGQILTGRLAVPDGAPLDSLGPTLTLGERSYIQARVEPDGTFTTDLFPADRSTGTLEVVGFDTQELQWESGPGTHDVGTVELTSTFQFVVQVTNNDEPVADARVLAYITRPNGRGTRRLGAGRTDTDGRVTLHTGAVSGLTISAAKHGMLSKSEELESADLESEEPLVIEMQRNAKIRGRVVDANSNGVAGAGVSFFTGERTNNQFWAQSYTDQSGAFTLSSIAPDQKISVVTRAHGFADTTVEVEALSPEQEFDVGDLTLDLGHTVSGVVSDEVGEGIEGAFISVYEDTGQDPRRSRRGGPTHLWATTNAEGRFQVSGITPGRYRFMCKTTSHESPQPQTHEVDEGVVPEVVFSLREGLEWIANIKLPNGQPAVGARVGVWSQSGAGGSQQTTDESGTATISNVPAGKVSVWVQMEGYRTPQLPMTTAENLPTQIVLLASATLEITLTVPEGRSIPTNYNFSLRKENNQWWNSSYSGQVSNGKIKKSGLEAGTFEVQLSTTEFETPDIVTVDLNDGQTTSISIALQGEPRRTRITVTNQQGDPVVGAEITVQGSRSYYGNRGRSVPRTDKNGYVEITNLRTPEEILNVHAKGYAPARIERALQKLDGDAIDVVLGEASKLFVHVVDGAGEPVDGVSVECRNSGFWDPNQRNQPKTKDGVVVFDELGAATYYLTFRQGETQLGSMSANLAEAEQKTVQFVVNDSTEVTGTVYADGTPVKAGFVTIRGQQNSNIEVAVASDGTYSATVRGTGTHWFRYSENKGGWGQGVAHEIKGPTTIDIEVSVVDFEGLVLDPQGNPAANVRGALSGPNSENFVTDADGRFSLKAIQAGTYTWNIWQFGDNSWFGANRTVEVGSVTEDTYQFDAGTEIVIEYTVSEGDPPNYVWIQYLGEGSNRQQVRQTSKKNTYVWPTSGGGTGMVGAQGFAPAYFDVDDPSQPISVVLEPGGYASFAVSNAGVAVAQQKIEIQPLEEQRLDERQLTVETAENGSTWVGLPTGRYNVTTEFDGSKTVTKEFEVTAGGQVSVVLAVE